MIKKFLSIILMITLTYNAMLISTNAMVNEGFSTSRSQSPQTVEANLYNVKKLPFVFLSAGITAISSILAGLIGYKIGNDRRVADEKEITLVGSIFPGNEGMPVGGKVVTYSPRLLISSFINKLFKVDIPKLSKENTFPASHLAAIEFQLKVYSDHFNRKNSSLESKKMADKLKNLSMDIGRYVDESNKKIQAGYLKSLLQETLDLVTEAGALSEKLEKEQNKAEL